MLETADEPVEGVAAEIGYQDTSFFSRLFRRRGGMTPAHYRRRFGSLRRALQGKNAGAPRTGVTRLQQWTVLTTQ
jgi:AraC-like DNA-binding protein